MRELLDQLYRQHTAGMTAALTRALGPANLDLVESAIQDAFIKALSQWPERGVPDKPPAWLFTVARNHALDVVRRDARFAIKRGALAFELEPDELSSASGSFAWELPDDQLRMMFVVCHPALSLESRVALVLHALCGLRTQEIAAALLSRPESMKKRLVRARKALREAGIAFELPDKEALTGRVEDVSRALYLLFSEGYSGHAGETPIRSDLCAEAMRLCDLVAAHPPTASPAVHALAALMALQASRLRARTSPDGRLLTLAEQDRGIWDGALIQRGLEHLTMASQGELVSEYHLEAGIAACHALAARFEDTDWARIVGYYDRLLGINPSPVIAVNRAIALAHARGPEAGMAALGEVRDDPRLRGYSVLAVATGEMLADLGDLRSARDAYERALELAGTEQERRLLRQKLADLA